jgi:predicted PurR-regulated permease PerM
MADMPNTKRLISMAVKGSQFFLPAIAIILLWKHVAPILLLLVLALLFSSILLPLVSYLESRFGGNRLYAVLAVYAGIIAIVVGLASFLVPVLINEAKSMGTALTGASVTELTASLKSSAKEALPEDLGPYIDDNMGQWIQNSGGFLQSLLGDLAGIMGRLIAMIMNMILVLVFTFIILLESHNFKTAFIKSIPNAYFELSLNLLDKIHAQVSGYLRGQGAAAGTVGILSTCGLYLLSWTLDVNIPYAFIIGMLAGFANLIPFIGPFVGMVPAILAYLMTPQAAGIQILVPIMIIVMFMVVQMIDNFFVSPKIMSASVGMHPLMVMIVIMIGGSLMGPLGMLFAVPAFGVVKVTLEEIVWGMKAYRLL